MPIFPGCGEQGECLPPAPREEKRGNSGRPLSNKGYIQVALDALKNILEAIFPFISPLIVPFSAIILVQDAANTSRHTAGGYGSTIDFWPWILCSAPEHHRAAPKKAERKAPRPVRGYERKEQVYI